MDPEMWGGDSHRPHRLYLSGVCLVLLNFVLQLAYITVNRGSSNERVCSRAEII